MKQEGGQPTEGVSFHRPPQGATELCPVEPCPGPCRHSRVGTRPSEGAGAERSIHLETEEAPSGLFGAGYSVNPSAL